VTRPVHLVACVAENRSRPARARDLYQSDWFRKARAYVEAHGGRWFILSALHGAVPPGRVIEPYDLALAAMSADDHRDWGARTAAQLDLFDTLP